MIVGSIKENNSIERRVSITPETSKNLIDLGLEVILEKDYANHLGILDKDYEKYKVKFFQNSSDVISRSNLLAQINYLSPEQSQLINEKNFSWNI